MARVLIVEDNADKLRRVYQCLGKVPGLSLRNVENCVDAAEAKRRLGTRKYELLIIDIAIPSYPDQDVSTDGGIVLLEEIEELPGLIVPDHIIGLTAYEELETEAQASFASKAWSVIRYSPESESWELAVQNKAAHIIAAEQGRSTVEDEYSSDLCIVCALDLELDAVRSLAWSWTRELVPNDHAVFYRGQYVSTGGVRVVHAATAARMGMTATAILATRMIHAFRPRYVAMTGIAAGIRGEVSLGDVIVADSSFDYGSGKWLRSGSKSRFLVDPHHIQLSPDLRPKVRLVADDEPTLSVIRKNWSGPKPDVSLRVHLGPLASGAAVVADGAAAASVRGLSRKLLGIDMETYGIFAAASESSAPHPVSLVMKGVCDFADEKKEDTFQQYAAYTSASVFAMFAQEWL